MTAEATKQRAIFSAVDRAKDPDQAVHARRNLVPPPAYAALDAAALAGAASGAVVGAVGGPAGIIIGASIGAAVGMLAGSALETDAERASAHDRALDDAIGVTTSALGARDEAAAALLSERVSEDESLAEIGARLRRDHARLDAAYAALLAAYGGGDWRAVDREWAAVESLLRRHIRLEEDHVLPLLERVDPAEAHAIRAEHAELVAALDDIGVGIELHAVDGAAANALIRRVRLHAEREEELLYPWTDAVAELAKVS
jgi:hypothetical protein